MVSPAKTNHLFHNSLKWKSHPFFTKAFNDQCKSITVWPFKCSLFHKLLKLPGIDGDIFRFRRLAERKISCSLSGFLKISKFYQSHLLIWRKRFYNQIIETLFLDISPSISYRKPCSSRFFNDIYLCFNDIYFYYLVASRPILSHYDTT